MCCLIDRLSRYCVSKNIITPEDLSWFKYGLEKRLSSLIVSIPFFILAVLLSNIYTAISFYFSFYYLRSRTNGFHSKSVWSCFILSLLCEVLFLGVLGPLINSQEAVIISIVCVAIIFVLAPYNHPNMHLSFKEVAACRISSRIRSCILLLGVLISVAVKSSALVNGFCLGIAMAACLLCLAYILKGGKEANGNSQ